MANFQNERDQLSQLEWLFQQKKFAEGLDRVETALNQFPASFHLKFLKFKFLRETLQHGEALQLLRQMHAMSGDNLMVLKELADLHFQLKQFPESLLYYKKLLFLDSFNSAAQERIKILQGTLEAGVADRLADTKIEFRPPDISQAPVLQKPLTKEVEPPLIRFESEESTAAQDAGPPPSAAGEEEAFQTESAAELYFKQGLYQEALSIYKNLFEKTGRTDYFLKIKAILLLMRTDRSNRLVERLQKFLELLQQRGSQIV